MNKIMLDRGLSGIDITKEFQRVVWDTNIGDRIKLEIVKLCGETEFRMIEGSDEFVQITSLLASIYLLID